MQIINGKKISNKILNTLQKKVLHLKTIYKKIPKLAIVLVGNKDDANIYVKLKRIKAKYIGIKTILYKFDDNVKEKKLIELIDKLNKNKNINAILIQLPLPKHINADTIIQSIDPLKDVDGFHKKTYVLSPLCQAIYKSLIYTKLNLKNKKVLIIAKSDIFISKLSNILDKKVKKIFHIKPSYTNIKQYTKKADIIISVIGKKYFFNSDKYFKKNTVFIDCGIYKENNNIYGDINYKLIHKKISYITPVPGGIGPLTIAYVLKNVIKLFIIQNKKSIK